MALDLIKFLLLLMCGQAWAQSASIGDPTRPPAAYVSGAAGEALAEPVGSRLRSVIVPKQGGRASAVIDGKVVMLGGAVGDAKVTRITESQVTLTGPNGQETLYLTPDVSKKTQAAPSARHRKKETP